MILCYNSCVKKIIWIFAAVLFTQTACDLQPKIQSLPDSVGDFISARYPALLADPNVNPDIYNSAATDYGVYASAELYGQDETNDYVMYASVDDYVVPIQTAEYGTPPVMHDVQKTYKVSEDDVLIVPIYKKSEKNIAAQSVEEYGDVLTVDRPNSGVRAVARVGLKDIRVSVGDTLYSLSRKYSVPVNDLAVINNLRPPFNLTVGQKLRVPNLEEVMTKQSKDVVIDKVQKSQKSSVEKEINVAKKTDVSVPVIKEKQDVNVKTETKKTVKAEKKISSNPNKKLPKIMARSSSKFSWPLHGKVLSNYGAKTNGLFNDGINIAAARGSTVAAAENGVVAYAGNEIKGMGNLVIIQHSDGWMTVYAHMDSMSVRRGSRVTVGQKIGSVGQTGKVDRPQLHFEIRKGTKAYNPMSYLKK